jgi:hypothetical protein
VYDSALVRALPKALSPWEAELAFLPDPLALALGGMLPKLAMLLGKLARSTTKTGEPDGYAQLSRRGPFDRLLLTQWALLDVVPEELLRRAASNELLFHELARKEPKTNQQSIALFDMGPMLLGAPRLAEMALLIVLARRAKDAGVPFLWGVLGDAEVHEYQGESSLRRLLNARTAKLPHLDTKEPTKSQASDDVWLIGHETSLPWSELRASSHVLLDEVIDAGVAEAETLSVTVRRAHKEETRSLSLKLPAPELCTAILRAPLTQKTSIPKAPVARAPSSSIDAPMAGNELVMGTEFQFSRDGSKLLARTKSGAVAVFAIPNPRIDGAKRPYIARPPSEYELIACGTAGKRVALVVRYKGVLYVRGLRGGPQDHLDKLYADEHAQALGPREVRPCYIGIAHPIERIPDVCFESSRGVLVWTSGSPDGPREVLEIHTALPLAPYPSGMAILESHESLPVFARLIKRESIKTNDVEMRVFAGTGPIVVGGAIDGRAMVAERTSEGARVIAVATGSTTSIAFPSSESLVGVTAHRTRHDAAPFPVIITATENALIMRGPEGECARITFHDELARIVCSPAGPRAAVMMNDGTIEVVALGDGTRLLRIQSPPLEGETR